MNLQQMRESALLTVDQLAAKANLALVVVYRAEAQQRAGKPVRLRPRSKLAICKVFGCQLGDIEGF